MKKGYGMSLQAWKKSLGVLGFFTIGMMLFLALYTTIPYLSPMGNGWSILAIYWGFYFPMAAYLVRRINRWSGLLA